MKNLRNESILCKKVYKLHIIFKIFFKYTLFLLKNRFLIMINVT